MEPEKLTATNRPIWATFSVALLSVAGVILLRWLLTPILGDRLQFITLSGGVAIAVWFGGWGPGVLAAIAGYALAQYLFILPRHSFDPRSPDLWAGLALYSFSCGIIIFMGEALRRARKRLEHHSSRLEQVIAEREQTELALAESGRRREVLYEFVERRHRATSLTDIYDSALDAVLRAVRCDRASISLLDDAGVAGFVAWRDLSDAYRETIEGHSAWKVDEPNPEPVWIPDVDAAKIEDSLGPVTKKEGIRALVFIPLVAEGKLIGKFTVYYNAPHVFDNEETELILTIARQLALGIERKRAEEKLSANEERLRLATQTGKMGIWEWDIPNNRISWTDSLFLMHGLTKDEFDGTVEAFGALVHPDDHESVSKAIERSLKDGVPYEITFRSVKSDGEIIWVFTNAVVLRSNGKVVRMIGATTDITELKRVEEALEKAKGEAEDANRAKDKFLAALSHELRTPLTPVLMTAAALEDDRTIATDLREQFGMVRRNIELEARLIDDLLDISRIAHGKLELQKEDVDIHGAIERALNISAPDLKTKKIQVIKHFDATEHYCHADAARLQEVFWNIIRNAVKFTPEGGKIDIVTKNDGDHTAIIEFCDDGIGIEPELQSKIFDAFEQGGRPNTAAYGGLGLGLAISKRIVDMHEGTIEAESAGSGKGSTFRIKLKTIPGRRNETKPQPSPAEILESALAEILVVEDHEDTANVLRRILENAGYAVKLCKSVDEARAAAAEHPFDLVISDIALAEGSGLELMRHLKEAHGLSGIALSGFGTQEDLEASKAAGFAAHLIKPVDLHRLRVAIAEVLLGKEGRRGSSEPATPALAQ